MRTKDEENQETSHIINKCQNAGKKVSPASAFLRLVSFISPASAFLRLVSCISPASAFLRLVSCISPAFRHQGQSGTADHGLVYANMLCQFNNVYQKGSERSIGYVLLLFVLPILLAGVFLETLLDYGVFFYTPDMTSLSPLPLMSLWCTELCCTH